jgi:chromosomal replication initiator protein
MLESAESIWSQAQDVLRGMLKPEIFTMWFAPLRARGIDGHTLQLETPDDFSEVWLRENYSDLLRSVASRAAGRTLEVTFCLGVGMVVATAVESQPQLPTMESPVVESASTLRTTEVFLNPNNTFETFVVGNNNNLAHGAAVAVAQNPGKTYNPLFFIGGVGLGKTHLLQAIGHFVLAHRKNARVAYLPCEKFTNEFIEALQSGQLPKFRKKYRQVDVLLIDDVQFLAGKERIQEEFFHTFNALHGNRKQIVLSCDRPASEIQGLEQRLVSRFEWGLTADLQPPDMETRQAILRKKERVFRVELPDEVRSFLAERIRSNIRRLEGAFVRIASVASLTGKPITLDVVENQLREILQEEGRQSITIDVIQRRVAEHYDIRHADMLSKRRPENIAFPRQVAMYLARQLTDSSLAVIGDAFGGRDHGTVLHACRQVKDRMEVDANVRQTVSYLEKQLLR